MDPEIGPVVARLSGVRFRAGGHSFEQDERYVLARVGNDVVGVSRPGDPEATAVAGHRWWSLEELMASKEIIYPRALTTVLGRLLLTGPPDTAWELTDA